MSNHYVDNKQLYQVLMDYQQKQKEAEEQGKPKPPIPEYVGACLIQIANRLSYKPNFMNYPFREEMVGDGIENCINYLDNFDANKSTNPFAYFTQIIYYAFLRRIEREKRQLYVKHKVLDNTMIMNELVDNGEYSDEFDGYNNVLEMSDYMKDFVENFEEKTKERKRRRMEKTKGVEKFYVRDPNDENSSGD